MPPSNVGPGALLTVAYAKSLYDERGDQLGIFMPLVLDVLGSLPPTSFTVADVQERLAAEHHIAMPQDAVTTLLHRATKKGFLVRAHGTYRRTLKPLSVQDIATRRANTEAAYVRLASALRAHAATRKLVLDSDDEALRLLMQFLEHQHIGLLLGTPLTLIDQSGTSQRAIDIAAEFVQHALKEESEFRSTLNSMVEALVLYRVTFLPDAASAQRRFSNLHAYFDSGLVRQALGYEGTAMHALAHDTLNVLKGSGVQCLVFDKTVDEIRRLLALYEHRLGTEQGRTTLRPTPMTRHFLTKHYSPSDVREMIALLEQEIRSMGLEVARMPKHERLFTFDEKKLGQYLADPTKHDELEPRVLHDVDCVAGVLTLRRGRRSVHLEDSSAVFVSASARMLRNARRWYREEDPTAGIDPAIHIRALSNHAWLKKPTLVPDFKLHELIALCSAALRPSLDTWKRFLRHLQSLQASDRITSNEATAIVVSALSDRLLLEAELDDEDDDIDAITLDDIVDRVKESYAAKAEAETSQARAEVAQALEAQRTALATAAAERTTAEQLRRTTLQVDKRVRTLAAWAAGSVYWLIVILIVIGASALVSGHPYHSGWIGILVAFAIVIFVLLEVFGILHHAREFRNECEVRLNRRLARWLGLEHADEFSYPSTGPSEL